MFQLLKELGIPEPIDDHWYSAPLGIEFYQRVLSDYGPNTVYDLGKAIPEHAVFPANITNIYEALSTLQITYELNHRGGYMGFYRMVSHDEEQRSVTIQCCTPYPSEVSRGLMTGIGRKYANTVRVYEEEPAPTERRAPYEYWYRIQYT